MPLVILYGFLAFLVCLVVHVFIWRFRLLKISDLNLIIIFLVAPTVVFTAIIVGGDHVGSFSRLDLAKILLLNLSLSCIYISSYPAAYADSPSLHILLIISSSKEERLSEEEIIEQYSSARIVTDRIDDLLVYGFISRSENRLELMPIGKAVVYLFILYRKILGLPMGGG